MQILRLLIILVLIYQPLTIKAEIIDQVVAIVGDKVITQYDIESFNPKKIKKIYEIENKDIRKKVLTKYYNEVKKLLIDQAALEIAAKREGVTVSDEEVDAALKQVLKTNNITLSQLEVLLLKENLTLPKYKLSIKQDMFQSRLRSRIIAPKIVLTQEDIKNKIDKLSDDLNLDDQLELRLIVLDNKTSFKEVEKYLKKHSFLDAAMKFSVDKSAKNGGYIGWIKVHSMSKELQKVAEGKTYGEIFKHIDKNGKKMLFYIEGMRSKYDIDPELRANIIKQLEKEEYDKVFKDWFKKSKEKIFIRYINS